MAVWLYVKIKCHLSAAHFEVGASVKGTDCLLLILSVMTDEAVFQPFLLLLKHLLLWFFNKPMFVQSNGKTDHIFMQQTRS